MLQWLRIRPPMQGRQARSLVQEDSEEQLSVRATATEADALESTLSNERRLCSRSLRAATKSSPCSLRPEKAHAATKTQHGRK